MPSIASKIKLQEKSVMHVKSSTERARGRVATTADSPFQGDNNDMNSCPHPPPTRYGERLFG